MFASWRKSSRVIWYDSRIESSLSQSSPSRMSLPRGFLTLFIWRVFGRVSPIFDVRLSHDISTSQCHIRKSLCEDLREDEIYLDMSSCAIQTKIVQIIFSWRESAPSRLRVRPDPMSLTDTEDDTWPSFRVTFAVFRLRYSNSWSWRIISTFKIVSRRADFEKDILKWGRTCVYWIVTTSQNCRTTDCRKRDGFQLTRHADESNP